MATNRCCCSPLGHGCTHCASGHFPPNAHVTATISGVSGGQYRYTAGWFLGDPSVARWHEYNVNVAGIGVLNGSYQLGSTGHPDFAGTPQSKKIFRAGPLMNFVNPQTPTVGAVRTREGDDCIWFGAPLPDTGLQPATGGMGTQVGAVEQIIRRNNNTVELGRVFSAIYACSVEYAVGSYFDGTLWWGTRCLVINGRSWNYSASQAYLFGYAIDYWGVIGAFLSEVPVINVATVFNTLRQYQQGVGRMENCATNAPMYEWTRAIANYNQPGDTTYYPRPVWRDQTDANFQTGGWLATGSGAAIVAGHAPIVLSAGGIATVGE